MLHKYSAWRGNSTWSSSSGTLFSDDSGTLFSRRMLILNTSDMWHELEFEGASMKPAWKLARKCQATISNHYKWAKHRYIVPLLVETFSLMQLFCNVSSKMNDKWMMLKLFRNSVNIHISEQVWVLVFLC